MLRLEEDKKAATFIDDEGRSALCTADQLNALYHIRSGEDLFANEDEFWLFDFVHHTVVVPANTDSLLALLDAWRHSVESDKAHEAVCAVPPLSWRQKTLGILPTTRTKLMVLPPGSSSALSDWEVVGPLSVNTYI